MNPMRDPAFEDTADHPTVGMDADEVDVRDELRRPRTRDVPPGGDRLITSRAAEIQASAVKSASVGRQVIGVAGIIAGAVIWAVGSPAPGITVIVATFALTMSMVLVGR